jgi:hypothetical protein
VPKAKTPSLMNRSHIFKPPGTRKTTRYQAITKVTKNAIKKYNIERRTRQGGKDMDTNNGVHG